MIEALVLDFDGVIVDTETPLFHAWAHTYAAFGAVPIEHADWCTSLGRNENLVHDRTSGSEISGRRHSLPAGGDDRRVSPCVAHPG